MKKIAYLFELSQLSDTDPAYLKLLLESSQNMGGPCHDRAEALRWLHLCAMEGGDEQCIVDEVNFLIQFQ